MGTLKIAIKKLPMYATLKSARRNWSEFWFKRQGTSAVKVGKFDILMPSGHPLPGLLKKQPYRDLCIGIAAKYFGTKYPEAALLDIGANIGDSAALMATYCKNDLILVEPSSFFYGYLEQNAKQLPNRSDLEQVFISPEHTVHGQLVHWGGTAFFESSAKSPGMKAKQLSSFNQAICMVKIDTDGNDFKIISQSIDWFEKSRAGVVFENQIRSLSELEASDAVLENLAKIGYRYFVVFDDPGYLILATTDIAILKELNRYLHRIWSGPNPSRSISNFDVIALHERDRDVFENITGYFKSGNGDPAPLANSGQASADRHATIPA